MSRWDEIKARLQERTYIVADQDWMIARISRLEEALRFYAYEIDWIRIDMNRGQKLRQIARTALEDGE